MRSVIILILATLSLTGVEAEADLWLRLDGVLAGRCTPDHLELSLHRRAEGLGAVCWGHAVGLNQGLHRGTVVATSADAATCTLDLAGTAYAPDHRAVCRLVLTPSPATAGISAGRWRGEVDGREVEGTWRGEERPPSPVALPEWRPVPAGTHPRLLTRADGLPALRRFLADDSTGQAVGRRLRGLIDQTAATDRKRDSWLAAGLAARWLLDGRPEDLTAAWSGVEAVLAAPLGADAQDIHHAPRLMGLAWAYDLAYQGLDETRRRRLASALVDGIALLRGYTLAGRKLSGTNDFPWSNHNIIRMGAVGVAALAVDGDGDGAGGAIDQAAALDEAVQAARLYLRHGLGETGWCMEGAYYRQFSLVNGLAPLALALRQTRGLDLAAASPLAWTMTWPLIESPSAVPRSGVSDEYPVGGMWPWALALAPTAWRGSLRGQFDREVGAAGNGSYGSALPIPLLVAAVALADAPAPAPLDALPLAAVDRSHGRLSLRAGWHKGAPSLVVHGKYQVLRACHHERSGVAGELRLAAGGRVWLDGRLEDIATARDLPLWGFNPSLRHPLPPAGRLGEQLGDRQAIVALDLTPAHRRADPRGVPEAELAKRGERRVHDEALNAGFLDVGVSGRRDIAADLSGAAALLVISERVQGLDQRPAWRLPLAQPAVIEGTTTRCTVDGWTLTVQVLRPAGALLTLEEGTLVVRDPVHRDPVPAGPSTRGGPLTPARLAQLRAEAAAAPKAAPARSDGAVLVAIVLGHGDLPTPILNQTGQVNLGTTTVQVGDDGSLTWAR